MTLREKIKDILRKARRSIAAAEHLVETEDFDFACSRAYYAVFYAIEGLLVTKGLSFSRHSAVIAAFNREFVKPGIFPRDFGGALEKLLKQRQDADYEFGAEFDEQTARDSVQAAARLLGAIEHYLIEADLDKE